MLQSCRGPCKCNPHSLAPIQGPSGLGPIVSGKPHLLPLPTGWHFVLTTENCWQFLGWPASVPLDLVAFFTLLCPTRYLLLEASHGLQVELSVPWLCSHSDPWTFHPIILHIYLDHQSEPLSFPRDLLCAIPIATSHIRQWSPWRVTSPYLDVSNDSPKNKCKIAH